MALLYDYLGQKIDLEKPIRFPQHKFINTNEYRRTGQYFLKNGVYTKAHPVYDSYEHKEFWDEEEKRCKEGYSVGGVKITGDHYAYLNFRKIKLTKQDFKDMKSAGRAEYVVKDLKHSAFKSEHFPDFWDGDFEYFHAKEMARMAGRHLIVGKARRKGYSYKNSTLIGNKFNLVPKSVGVIGAYLLDYLYPEGTMAMTVSYLDFLNEHTDWTKARLHNRMDYIESGFTVPGRDQKYGFRSKIITVGFKDNPGAARGKDGEIILFEEAGKFPNLKAAFDSTKDTAQDGMFTTGLLIVFGTGGNDAVNWEDFEELFYEANANQCLAFENVYDEEEGTNEVCGFFHPDFKNLVGFTDENGNSLVTQALEYENGIRNKIARESSNPNAIADRAMEHANKPSEAFKRSVNNILPVIHINERIKKLKHNPDIKYLSRNGTLIRTSEGVKLITNEELKRTNQPYHEPIIEFPLKHTKDLTGCITEYYPPYKDNNGNTPKNMYRIWLDPYAHDKDPKNIMLKDSLGAAYVYERPNKFTPYKGQRIAASYVGRPPRVDDFNEQLFLLAERYNAEIFFENERGDTKPYAQRHKKLHYLASEPLMLWNKELASITGRGYGMHVNDQRKGMGIIYLRDFLMEVVGVDPITDKPKVFLDYINDIPLLEEFRKLSKKGNFDRASAWIVGMFDVKEETHTEIIAASRDTSTNSFFNRNLF